MDRGPSSHHSTMVEGKQLDDGIVDTLVLGGSKFTQNLDAVLAQASVGFDDSTLSAPESIAFRVSVWEPLFINLICVPRTS